MKRYTFSLFKQVKPYQRHHALYSIDTDGFIWQTNPLSGQAKKVFNIDAMPTNLADNLRLMMSNHWLGPYSKLNPFWQKHMASALRRRINPLSFVPPLHTHRRISFGTAKYSPRFNLRRKVDR